MNLELSATARRRAGLAIENTHKEYTREGGLKDLSEKMERSEQKTSTYIYGLARFAFESPNIEDPDELFNAMCLYAEEQFKSKHKVDNLKSVLPPWATFKSNINRAIRMGLKPTEYGSEWELRKAVAEEASGTTSGSAAQRTKTASSPPASQGPKTLLAPQAEEWVATTTIHGNLKPLIERLAVQAEFVKKDLVDEASDILSEASTKLATLIDNRRVRDPATKTLLQHAVH